MGVFVFTLRIFFSVTVLGSCCIHVSAEPSNTSISGSATSRTANDIDTSASPSLSEVDTESTSESPSVSDTGSLIVTNTSPGHMANNSTDGPMIFFPLIAGAAAGSVVLTIVMVTILVVMVCRKRQMQYAGVRDNHVTPENADRNNTSNEHAALVPLLAQDAGIVAENGIECEPHVYANSAPKAGPATAAVQDLSAGLQPAGPKASASAQSQNCLSVVPYPGQPEGDSANADVVHFYGNDTDLYRRFLSSDPKLDSVQECLVKNLASGKLRSQFKNLKKCSDIPKTVAALPINIKKNRFRAIVPYDKNRVVLSNGEDQEGATDFINASYIQGFNSENKYIAAQGPSDSTVLDFWRMVWQEKITHIVMLTNLIEVGKSKCVQYWPEQNSEVSFDPFTLIGENEESRASFDIRTFTLKRSEACEDREVVQYHYTAWPDHDVPSATSLVMFLRRVAKETRGSSAPLLVHCSAGVGRTGTFIGLGLGMERAVREGAVDVEQLVVQMREQRCLMVQAPDQFVFLHKVLLEAYTARDTLMELEDFGMLMTHAIHAHTDNAHIDTEFETVMNMKSLTEEQSNDFAMEGDNLVKNRNLAALPADSHLVYLREHVPGRNQYINAVYVPTFRDAHGCILTQLPLPNTLIDFWRMVWGSDVTTIVSLAAKDEDKEIQPYCWYWPRSKLEDDVIQTGDFVIRLQSHCQIGDSISSYTVTIEKKDLSAREVRVLRYEDWAGEVPANMADFLHLLEEANNAQNDGKGSPVVVQCSDGVARSGLFAAICDVVNRMTYDHEVDVYMTVRQLHTVLPDAVTSPVQYRFCYEVVQHRLEDMNVYVNA